MLRPAPDRCSIIRLRFSAEKSAYGGVRLPKGYLHIHIGNTDHRPVGTKSLHPANPGSIYHITKLLNQYLCDYYDKNDRLRMTDLQQDMVMGAETEEEKLMGKDPYPEPHPFPTEPGDPYPEPKVDLIEEEEQDDTTS